VTTCKTVSHKVRECCEEQYCVPGKKTVHWEKIPGECCFDPCTCKCCCKPAVCRKVVCQGPAQVCTRKVWHTRTVCEQVPCTTYVKECVHVKVPYTVCKKVPYTVVKQVPYTVCRVVKETQVKKVPYTVTRMQTEICKKQIPYTVTRNVCGAYVDAQGVAYECEGPGRTFQEGAQVCRDVCTTTCRMVKENCVKQVPYTVWRTVQQECVKKVPYTVCRMETCVVNKQVPYKTCQMVPYTVTCKVPYTVTECVPCTVCKKVKVCVPQEVCVKRPRWVCCTEAAPCCPAPSCCNPCCEKESWVHQLFHHRMACEPCCDSGCGSCGK
jgi:hypothetical protein